MKLHFSQITNPSIVAAFIGITLLTTANVSAQNASEKTAQQKIVCNYKAGVYNSTANKNADFSNIKFLVLKLESNDAMKNQMIQGVTKEKERLPEITFIQDVIQQKLAAKNPNVKIVSSIAQITEVFTDKQVGYVDWKMSNQYNRCADGSFSQEITVQIINDGRSIYQGVGEYLGLNASDDIIGATTAALQGL